MKKQIVFSKQTVVMSLVLLFFATACSSTYKTTSYYKTNSIEIQVLKPAEIDIPVGVSQYGIVHQLEKEDDKPLKITKSTKQHLHDNARKSCLNGLYSYINNAESDDSAIVIEADRRMLKDTSEMYWTNIKNYCAKHNVDALIYVDRLHIDHTRVPGKHSYEQYGDLKLKTTWIVLFPEIEKRIEKDIEYNKLAGMDVGKDQFIYSAAENSGAKFGKQIIPGWMNTKRKYFTANNDAFEAATERFTNADWDGAAKIWEEYLNSESTNYAGKAHFNLALYYEIQGDLDQAFELAKKADQVYKVPHSHDYAGLLYKRIKDQFKLAEQMAR